MTIRYTFGHYLNQCVEVGGQRIALTRLENELFFALYVSGGRPVSKYDIADMLWGHREDGGPLGVSKLIDVLAYNIRQKTGAQIWGNWHPGLVMGYQPAELIKEQQRAAA